MTSEIAPGDAEGLAAGIAPRVREAKLQVARALLAVRRGDDSIAEALLCNAQLTLHRVEISLPHEVERARGG